MSLLPPAPPLLAFANPALFWTGLGLVAVPVLIHFFFRRRHRVIRWAAMDFLLAALRKQKRRMEIENLVLLLLRCAAILLLALGLARPGCSAPSIPFAGGARAVVLVMDTSASMGAVHTGRTALDRGKERAAQFLSELPAGSKVTLVASRDEAAAGGPRAVLENAEPGDARVVLAGMRTGYGPNDLRAAFTLAAVQRKGLRGRPIVVFVTDLQRRDWLGDTDGRKEGLFDTLRERTEADGPVPVVLVDVGQDETANVVVANLSVDAGQQAFAGKLLGITATLFNYGPSATQGTLTLQVAQGEAPWEKVMAEEVVVPAPGLGQPEPLQRSFTPRIPARGDGTVRFRAVFTARADIADRDRLAVDSERVLALRVRPPVRILPVATYSGSLDIVRDVELTEVIEFLQPIFPADLQGRDLDNVDVILWADPEIAALPPEDALKLKAFVKAGGGFLAYLARRGDPLRPLFEGDDPLLPARIGEVRRDEEHPVLIEREDDRTQAHPLFKETRQPLFFSPEVTGYAQVSGYEDRAVVARYTNGDPAVLEKSYGRGRVVVITTTPAEMFFRLNGSLLPAILFFNASQYLVWESPARRNVTAGEPADVRLPPGTREVEVTPPAAAGGASREPVADGATEFRLADTSTPGFYRIVARGVTGGTTALPTESAIDIAANPDPAEGDLRRVAAMELKQAYQGAPLHFTDEKEPILPRGSQGSAVEASRAFLGGVVAILLVELLCAWRFGTRRRSLA
ncbi:MAG TPA: BatA domain-containing protein [Planctomycetota bacterium]|nr:BatA domain-containing protein [Planctomycetota bacterium]